MVQNRIWESKVKTLESELDRCVERSSVLDKLETMNAGREWRAVVRFDTETFVRDSRGEIVKRGPVVVGIRINQRMLGEAPSPLEVAMVLSPFGVFHPNCHPSGTLCLGHPAAGISLDTILHQVWAGLVFNMKLVRTSPHEVLNPAAAAFVRDHVDQLPLTDKGLFE